MNSNTEITLLLGRLGVSSYSLWRVRGPAETGIAWIEGFALGIDGRDRLIVETREDGTWTVFQQSWHKRPEAMAASIAGAINASPPPPNTYPMGGPQDHPRENAGGIDVWSDSSGQSVYRK